MTSKLARYFVTASLMLSALAFGQTTTPAPADSLPAAPGSTPTATAPGGNKVGTINIEEAIFASNEGQRDFEALNKKLEPKQNELKGQNDEVESLKKQLTTQGDKLSDDARATLVKQVEDKQKKLERSVQDARDDATAQQNEIAKRILQKMAPIVVKYASDNGYGVIIDTSNPWPNGPVLWTNQSNDITKPVVDAYNTVSGVPVQPRPAGTSGGSGAKSGTGSGTKTAPASKPATTAPAPKQ